jgi:anti-anti-sigma regulatory factor
VARVMQSRTVMLRISHNDVDAQRVILLLEGHILLEWAELLERECEALLRSGRHVALDFSRVVFIGRTGFEALRRLGRLGVEMVGCSPLVADMLEHEGITASTWKRIGRNGR